MEGPSENVPSVLCTDPPMGNLKEELYEAIDRRNSDSVKDIIEKNPELVNCEFQYPGFTGSPLLKVCVSYEKGKINSSSII